MIIKKSKQEKLNNKTEIKPKNIKEIKKGENIDVENFSNKVIEETKKQEEIIENISAENKEEPEIDLFDIENIDFEDRQERRRGSRRRGYRRIDDRNLISRAQEESENIKKSAFEEGYKKGMEQCDADLEALRNQIKNFMSAKKDVFEFIAPDIMEISLDIAKKIIKKEAEADPQVLIDTIVDVLKHLSKNEPRITIRVKSQAVQFLKDSLPDITYQQGIESKISVIADSTIEDGGCILETNNGIVDATVSTQIEIIKKALEGI